MNYLSLMIKSKPFQFLKGLVVILLFWGLGACKKESPPAKGGVIINSNYNAKISFEYSGKQRNCHGPTYVWNGHNAISNTVYLGGMSYGNAVIDTTLELQISIYNIDSLSQLNGLIDENLPLQANVADTNTDVYVQFNIVEHIGVNDVTYTCTDLNFSISDFEDNYMNGNFNGTFTNAISGEIKTVSSGEIIDVLYD